VINIDRDTAILKKMNWLAIAAIVLLAGIGLLFVYSASRIVEDQPVMRFYRQLMWLCVASGIFVYIVIRDYRKFARDSWWIYGITIILLILVLLVGTTTGGAKRWLFFLGMGFQPAEFAKIATIMLLAKYMSRPDVDFDRWSSVGTIFLLAGIPILLIGMEPAVGTALVFVPATFAMMLIARVRGRILTIIIVTGVAFVILALSAIFVPAELGCSEETQTKILKCVGLKPYHKKRILSFFRPGNDPMGADWNKRQSAIAIGSGGLHGKGYRNGMANVLCYLPKTVAPTDFIFSVLSEEEGFIGSTAVLFLFVIVMATGMWTAATAADTLGRLLCVGMTTLVFIHVFVNAAMTMGLLPVAGLPLPLMSSGGSFLVSMMVGLGIIQSVHVRRRYVR